MDDLTIIEVLEILADCELDDQDEPYYGTDGTQDDLRRLIFRLANFGASAHKNAEQTRQQFEEAIEQRGRRIKVNEELEKENELLRYRNQQAQEALAIEGLSPRVASSLPTQPTDGVRVPVESPPLNERTRDELVALIHEDEPTDVPSRPRHTSPDERTEGDVNEWGDTWRNGRWETS